MSGDPTPYADQLRQSAAEYRPGPDASEMSWGSGLTPPGLEDAPPSEGGRYRGKAPRIDDGGLNALDQELQRRRGILHRQQDQP